MSQHKVTVRILDREYQFAATDDERASLLSAADQLDSTMRTIKDSNSSLAADKIAIMAALNISHEMMKLKDAQQQINQINENLQSCLSDK